MRAIDLTPPQSIAMRKLLDGPLPMGSVAEVLSCDASTLTGIADRLEDRQLPRFFLDEPRNPKEKLPALASRHFAPDILVSFSRRFHRKIDVPRVRFRDLRQLFFRRRIDRVEIFPRLRLDEFSVDKQRISLLELNVIVRFRRRRVAPAVAEVQPPFVERQRGPFLRRWRITREHHQIRTRFLARHAFFLTGEPASRTQKLWGAHAPSRAGFGAAAEIVFFRRSSQ